MRLITGTCRGAKLHWDSTSTLRPTKDRVREALMSILRSRISQSRFLDLFAGTGAVGLEALSAGASHVTFVDQKTHFIKKNIGHITDHWNISPNQIDVIQMDSLRFLKTTPQRYDIIYVDPPWNITAKSPDNDEDIPSLFTHSLKAIFDFGILNPSGLIICEHPTNRVPEWVQKNRIKQYHYGQTTLSIMESDQPVIND